MPPVKKISYKIVNGQWKSPRMAKMKGLYTYPVLLTIIEDVNGAKIEVPLSYVDIGDMIQKHIWLERCTDWDSLRDPERLIKVEYLKAKIDEAEKSSVEAIRGWFNNAKEEGGFKEDEKKG